MRFELLPVVDAMLGIYRLPRDRGRFDAYIKLLTGNTNPDSYRDDLDVPIGYFNPMAKPHVAEKLQALKDMGIEKIMNDELIAINKDVAKLPHGTFKVVMALADDAQGGWTNRFTTDHDSKFKPAPLNKRHFCVPVFWVSELIDEALIRRTTAAYCYRVVYQLSHPKPETLADHLAQEKFVASYMPATETLSKQELQEISDIYAVHQHTTAYPIIFNFLYGDEAAAQLGYAPIGIKPPMAAFKFAALR